LKTIIAFALLLLFASFRKDAGIVTDLVEKARTENKLVAVYFSGSDWCSVCRKFKKEVLETETVAGILNTEMIFYNADFPQRTKLSAETAEANDRLAEKLNESGRFPLLVIMDADWNVRSVIGYGKSADEVVSELKSIGAQ
jgi:thioredoxin-related protein